jgi:Bacterial PH domain
VNENRPLEPSRATAQDAVPVDLPLPGDTQPFARVTVGQPLVMRQPAPPVAAELAGMLLPTEHVVFASSPHWIVFARPLAEIVAVLVLLATVLSWRLLVLVHGHHILVPLVSGPGRLVVLGVAGLLLLRSVIALAGRAMHYFGYRVVSTNRRIFIVQGLFGRRVDPLGNTGLAGSTMSQGILGRMLGFGSIVLGGGIGPAIRDMRDPIRLYREFQAVANGVDGDTWTPAIRQTQIP